MYVHSPKISFYETELFLADWKTGLLCRMIQMMREQNIVYCTILMQQDIKLLIYCVMTECRKILYFFF